MKIESLKKIYSYRKYSRRRRKKYWYNANIISDYFKLQDLKWKNLVGCCTDGTLAMIGCRNFSKREKCHDFNDALRHSSPSVTCGDTTGRISYCFGPGYKTSELCFEKNTWQTPFEKKKKKLWNKFDSKHDTLIFH